MTTTQSKNPGNRIPRRLGGRFEYMIVGAIFVIYGSITINRGDVFFGSFFVAVGLIPITLTKLFQKKAKRVGANIIGDALVIQHTFSKTIVPLENIRRVYLSLDTTVVETVSGIVVIEDDYFEDSQKRESLLQTLQDAIKPFARQSAVEESTSLKRDSNNPLSRLVWRCCMSSVLILVGTFFSYVGFIVIEVGGTLFGSGILVIGLALILAGLVDSWRGGRIGIHLTADNLIIQHYFSDTTVPLNSIRQIYRSVDKTVVETTSGKVVIEDTYFDDSLKRHELLHSLQERLAVTA